MQRDEPENRENEDIWQAIGKAQQLAVLLTQAVQEMPQQGGRRITPTRPTIDTRLTIDIENVERAAIQLTDYMARLRTEMVQAIRDKEIKEYLGSQSGQSVTVFRDRGVSRVRGQVTESPLYIRIDELLQETDAAIKKVVEGTGRGVKNYIKIKKAFSDLRQIISDISTIISVKLFPPSPQNPSARRR